MTYRFAIAAGLLAVAGCTSPAADRNAADDNAYAPARASAEQSDCFNARNINGYSEVDRDTIRVRVGARDYYDIDVTPACYGLEWENRLAVVSNSQFICVDRGPGQGDVVTENDRCMITDVRHSPRRPAEDDMTPYAPEEAD